MARSLPEDGQQPAPELKVDGGPFLNVLQAQNGFQSLKQLLQGRPHRTSWRWQAHEDLQNSHKQRDRPRARVAAAAAVLLSSGKVLSAALNGSTRL